MTIKEKPYIKVPTWKDGHWIERTVFQTKADFLVFVQSLFKEPGKYQFDETSNIFREQATRWENNKKVYCAAAPDTAAFDTYWDAERRKCRRGAIFIHGSKIWYIPGELYMWWNFLPINVKSENRFRFPDVRDVHYHMALYELIAELKGLHAAILKKRQVASSYYHAAKLICQIWHEETPILKMGASLGAYVDNSGTWKFLEEYRSFLNEHTAWYRDMNPGGEGKWQQQVEVDMGHGKKVKKGLKGTLTALSFENSNTKGVGGACRYFFYEEAGIAPTMDITYEFIRPALREGGMVTGQFIAAGSVGELEHCEPLKDMILNPDSNEILPVEHNLMDENWTYGKTGLFIPEQWGMPPFIDQYGNSMVEDAIEGVKAQRKHWLEVERIPPERYRYRKSQYPLNIEEAFGARKESKFPVNLVNAQKKRIERKDYPQEYVELEYNDKGQIVQKKTNKVPILEFPVKKNLLDKEGVIVIHERPDKDAEWGTYLASIDPVSEGKTVTSESLCSIYVYKNPVQVTEMTSEGPRTYIEQDKIVAWWCGRFDDLNKTHERLEMIIKYYNAWTIVENNISLFIQYMIGKNLQKYLVQKNMIAFLKELKANLNVFQDYGWKNTGTIFRVHLLNYLIEYLKEEIDEVTDEKGEVKRVVYGIERIPDIMAMKEMSAYHDKLNVDRLVSLAALIAFAKILQTNKGYSKRIERDEDDPQLDKSKNFSKLNSSPFKHIGRSPKNLGGGGTRSPFKNIR